MGLLEYAACDDLSSFRREVEEKGLDLDEPGLWYCKKLGSNKMGLEQRTPLMVAAMYGSKKVLTFIVSTGKSDVNRACGEERVTALHCAVAGCSVGVVEVINALLDASALANAVDANGNSPLDLFARVSRFVASPRRKAVELLLRGGGSEGMMISEAVEEEEVKIVSKYPADASLPDINEGVYGSDEFRMYSFKVKPCSRAYSHDWTECAFVHPGENARRRDPRKYPYTCVPCPEFRKGSCPKGDSCEYAHGVFESWLHPAQYKTRLCKDETGCARKVCFFAHRREEMRPVNASTGSAVSQSPLEMMNGLSPLAYSSGVSTRPVSPMGNNSVASSPRNGSWQNRVNSLSPPTLQLNGGSRLKSTLSARDLDIDMEMELRLRGFNNVEESFGSYVSSPSRNSQMGQNMNQHYPSSPVRQQPPSHHFDSSAAVAAAVMNARSSAFAKRSLSFKPQVASSPSNLSDWGSPSGKLDWGVQGDELSKMRRSVSFGIRGDNNSNNAGRDYRNEPDVSWVNSLVKDSVVSERGFGMNERVRIMSWAEQMYREKEQTVV
ncbi:Zinc finger CCCH domain-containing protein 47 [Raphanus sativus]|uniref:Zinc finger CCCH domain-containing protein 47 n=1 Tax=Raphanus sativus TaxID=3726 RepID=A0A6J0P6G3_RAPSA|nr:zinc finger CCCH domain-containing protein 47 [Raphanus sativus]KAJ4895942.1 Zinc finger CCCH domain-containing protein 47 [Raphanus sativus]